MSPLSDSVGLGDAEAPPPLADGGEDEVVVVVSPQPARANAAITIVSNIAMILKDFALIIGPPKYRND
jgi:hypothetical protein